MQMTDVKKPLGGGCPPTYSGLLNPPAVFFSIAARIALEVSRRQGQGACSAPPKAGVSPGWAFTQWKNAALSLRTPQMACRNCHSIRV